MHPNGTKRGGGLAKRLFVAFVAGAFAIGGVVYAADKLTGTGVVPAISAAVGGGSPVTASVGTGTGSVADIAKQAGPAVVKISSQSSQAGRFSNRFGSNGSDDSLQTTGTGSGFIFDASGYILTNDHVISGADRIEVTVQGEDQPYTAKVLGHSQELDLAVIKIEGTSPFPALKLGDSDTAQIGDAVVAIGNPYDFDFSVTTGIVSSTNREISISDELGTVNYKHLIQTDTAINPGNSGGPLLNMRGEVVGMNTAVNSEAQGIGFAITSNTIDSVLKYLVNNTDIPKTVSAELSQG